MQEFLWLEGCDEPRGRSSYREISILWYDVLGYDVDKGESLLTLLKTANTARNGWQSMCASHWKWEMVDHSAHHAYCQIKQRSQ
jgi:hypothetical protein